VVNPNSKTHVLYSGIDLTGKSDMAHASKQGKVTRHNAWAVKLTEHVNEDGLIVKRKTVI
jgi:hypothetical protein